MIPPHEMLLRLLVATVLSGFVGLERERLDRAAGLRTHALVGLGAALFMLVSAFGFGDIRDAAHVTLDPSRVAAQVVSGIGFLGAGTIIFQREIIRGLTTAASVWAVAAVGLAVGGGLYLAAVSATVLMLGILAGLKPVEHRFFMHRRPRLLSLSVDRQTASLFAIETAIAAAGLRLERMLVQPGSAGAEDRVQLVLAHANGQDLPDLMEHLRQIPGVREIELAQARGGVDTLAS